MQLTDQFDWVYSPQDMAEAEGWQLHRLLAAITSRRLQIIREKDQTRRGLDDCVTDDEYDGLIDELKRLREEMRDLNDVSITLSSLLKSPAV